jgi:two-component system sensor histidine kinase NreB
LEIRRIVAALSTVVLERLGLGPALKQLAARFQRMHTAEVRVRIAAASRELPMEIQEVIYRVTQEALQNIAKHSQASRVNLSLGGADKSIRLHVTDNGGGFHAETASAQPMSFGLAGMQERAALLGGTLAIRSAPGKGSTITLELPRYLAQGTRNGKDTRIVNR